VNLGIAPYMFSKIAVLGTLCLLQSAVLVFVVNAAAPIQQGIFLNPVLEVYITMALTSIAGLMLGLTVSALAPNSDRAMSIVPIVLLPQVIFSGVIFALNTPFLQALGALFAARWAMAGMGSSVGLHGDKLGADGFSFVGTLFTSVNPKATLPGAETHLLLVWIVLVAMIVLLSFAIAYFLKQKDTRA
jgi:ABC transport system ATP-binding/permease protein